MLSKSECLSILVKMEDNGIAVNQPMKELVIAKDIPVSVLEFIVKNKGIELYNFYEMLRKKHNQSKSPLYINILKLEDSKQDIITTLTCLLTQVVLYSNKLTSNKEQFLKEARAEEITRVLNNYFNTFSPDDCYTVLRLVRTDLLVLEGLAGRREISNN